MPTPVTYYISTDQHISFVHSQIIFLGRWSLSWPSACF